MNSRIWMNVVGRVDCAASIKADMGQAIFRMAELLVKAVVSKEGVLISEVLDVKLDNFIHDDKANYDLLAEYFEELQSSDGPIQFFCALHALQRVNKEGIISRIEDLLAPTFGTSSSSSSFWDRLETDWGGGLSARVIQGWEGKVLGASRKLLLTELYSLIVLRFLELKFGAIVEVVETISKSPSKAKLNDGMVSLAAFDKLANEVVSMKESINQLIAAIAHAPNPALQSAAKTTNPKTNSEKDESDDDSETFSDESVNELQDNRVSRGAAKLLGISQTSGKKNYFPSSDHSLYSKAQTTPLVSGTGSCASWLKDDLVKASLDSACSTFEKLHEEVSMSSIMAAITSETGFVMIDIRGIPHVMKSSTSKKCSSVLKCVIFNPSANADLSRLSIQALSPNLFPMTDNHFDRLLDDQCDKALETSYINFIEDPRAILRALSEYRKKFRALRVTHLWNRNEHSNTQANPFHITTWTVMLLFHVNIWMKALTHKNISILVNNFDLLWSAHYGPRLAHGEPPKISLQRSLELLEYRHDKCKIRGTCNLYCAHCSIDVKPQSKASDGDSPATKAFYSGYREWKKIHKDGSLNAYLTSNPSIKKPPSSGSPSASASVSITAAGVEAYVKEQHRILLHDGYEF